MGIKYLLAENKHTYLHPQMLKGHLTCLQE